MAAALRARASAGGSPPPSPCDAAVAPAGLTAAQRQAAIVAVHLPGRPDLDAAECMAWIDAFVIVLKARCPHNAAGIDSDAAAARELCHRIEAHTASLWPLGEGNRRQRDKASEAGQQGVRASLDAVRPTLREAGRVISAWGEQSRCSRLVPPGGRRVELSVGSHEEEWTAWMAALAQQDGCVITAVANETPVFARPGDDGAAVLARYERLKDDFTELERDCRDASSALYSLVWAVQDFLRAADRLRRYGQAPVGTDVFVRLKQQALQDPGSQGFAIDDLVDLNDMRAYLRGLLADDDFFRTDDGLFCCTEAGRSYLARTHMDQWVDRYATGSQEVLWQQALSEELGCKPSDLS